MRCIRIGVIFAGILSAHNSFIWAKGARIETTASAMGVEVSLAPSPAAGQSSIGAKVRISITNNSKDILVHRYPVERGSIRIEVSTTSGTVPPETRAGCKLHMSVKCGPEVKLGGPVSFSAIIVMPGETIWFDKDLASEYILSNISSVMVDVIAEEFVLVDAPNNVTQASPEVRRAYLIDYSRYNYTRIVRFRSNVINLQLR